MYGTSKDDSGIQLWEDGNTIKEYKKIMIFIWKDYDFYLMQ